MSPTVLPTSIPSASPTRAPTAESSASPTALPTRTPSARPTKTPSTPPYYVPKSHPTSTMPSYNPTIIPSITLKPSKIYSSKRQTEAPIISFSMSPTAKATKLPSALPSRLPNAFPSASPTHVPTAEPSLSPTALPTSITSSSPTHAPIAEPSVSPTALPTSIPSASLTRAPTAKPSESPTALPTSIPSASPTRAPTAEPSMSPTALPTSIPSARPTHAPTVEPSMSPTALSTGIPSASPTHAPTAEPSVSPTALPTSIPSEQPIKAPSTPPSYVLTSRPTTASPTDFTSTSLSAADRSVTKCEIVSYLTFSEDTEQGEFFNNDNLSVWKVVTDEDIYCDLYNSATYCAHSGADGAFILGDDDYYYQDYDSQEYVTIEKAAGSSFVLMVDHVLNYYEVVPDDGDHNMQSGILSVAINDIEHVETWMRDVDEDYTSSFKVQITCTDDCNCSFEKILDQKCVVTSYLTFPDDASKASSFHDDNLYVQRVGSDYYCSYYYYETDYCRHSGTDAAFFKESAVDDDYYTFEESITIGNAAGQSFVLFIEHEFNEFEAQTARQNGDHEQAGILAVAINGILYEETWIHDVEQRIHTHTKAKEINEDYDSLLSVVMTCSEDCECSFVKTG